MAAAVTSLTREIMTLQAEGNYAKAKALIEELGVVRPTVQKVLDRLATVPVDIEPRFSAK
jgi:Mn-dependent DtxR family transcriptional regulator